MLIQVAFDLFGPFPGPPNILFGGQGSALYFRYAAILGVVAGVAALWRPSFLAPLFLYYVGWRELIGTVSGIRVVDTDYLGMIDVGYFSTLGAFVVIWVTSAWTLDRFPFPAVLPARREDSRGGSDPDIQPDLGLRGRRTSGKLFLVGGRQDPGQRRQPADLGMHNPTQTSIVIGLERGDNPLATFPHVLQMVWDGIIGGQPYLNIVVFASPVTGTARGVVASCPVGLLPAL